MLLWGHCHVPCAFLPATCWGTEHHQYGVMSLSCHVNVMHPVPFFRQPAGELNNIISMASCCCHVPCTLLLPTGELNNTVSFGSGHCHVHVMSPMPSFCRVCTEKSFKNSQTFHKPLQYGTEKQHEGTQLFHTSGKGVQPLLEPMASALCQAKVIGSAFFPISHDNVFFCLNYCLVLGNTISD